MFDKAIIEGKEVIIVGDINLDYLKPTILPSRWTSIVESYNMTQIIKELTRVTKRTKSCIDYKSEHVGATEVPQIGLSDHFQSSFIHKEASCSTTQ